MTSLFVVSCCWWALMFLLVVQTGVNAGSTSNETHAFFKNQEVADRNFFGEEIPDDHHELQQSSPSSLNALLQRLEDSGYDNRLRPHMKGRPIYVSCSIHIGSISAISESRMDYTIDFYFRQSWDDYRLQWNSTNVGEEQAVNIAGDNIDFIWKPDTFFPNAKLASFHDVTRHNGFTRVLPHGHVKLSTRLKITAYCPMDLHYFPLDHQKCSLYVESFSLSTKDIFYSWTDGKSEMIAHHALGFGDDISSLTQFAISGFRIFETFVERQDGYNHSRLVIDIYFARNLGYYLIQVYLPAALMVISSWIAFWLPRNSSPARITLGVTTVLTVVTLSGQEYTSLPKISYLKALDIYLLFCFAIVFVSLLEFAVVSYTMRTSRRVRHVGGQHNDDDDDDDKRRERDDSDRNVETRPRMTRFVLPSPPARRRNRYRVSMKINVDAFGLWYLSIPSRVEWASRIGFPFVFLVFNVIYWYYFFFLHHDSAEDEPGFIPLQ